MVKSKLCDLVVAKSQKLDGNLAITPAQAQRAVTAIIEVMRDSFIAGENIAIRDFGTFVCKTKAPRKARNVATGSMITVPPQTAVRFRPCDALKAQLIKK